MPALDTIDECLQKIESTNTRDLYFALFNGNASACDFQEAAHYLRGQLKQSEKLESDLPGNMHDLGTWMQSNTEKVGKSYRRYLDNRQSGQPRIYFQSKSHALYFLKTVAPTKMVDGAWLYGLLERWKDSRFNSLIQTYLEELGEGAPGQNHVALYKRLLTTHGCEQWKGLSDTHYVQGAIQLALAYNADQFLPEIIGFNLGYEQLPLHLLITAYELKELGIDPYYFTLHITVDNGDSGHAKKAVDAVFDAMPQLGNSKEFYQRICNGYKLNYLGICTQSAIESFDINREMVTIFSTKGIVGRYAHSDYRHIAGRSITDWLSHPDQSDDLITAMEKDGWFKRHQDPRNSRFWKLISGEKAKMAGVFNNYEQQVIYDWIAGDSIDPQIASSFQNSNQKPQISFERKQQLRQSASTENFEKLPVFKQKASDAHNEIDEITNDFDAELQALHSNLSSLTKQEEAMNLLISLMSPASHHTESGLMATRIFSDIFR